MRGHFVFLGWILLFGATLIAQNVIDVSEQGISDGVRNSKQQDRDEAIMDAKLKAIEKAGVDIQSVTTVENFQLKRDWIESKAKAYLLPGFQIIEMGYGVDELYHVVLVGKVSVSSAQKEKTDAKSAKPVVNLNNPAGIEFVFIKGGTFQMGDVMGDNEFADEKPVHMVTVSDFYLGKTEVTVAQYRTFCNATGRSMPEAPSWGWQDNHPVVNVSWDVAKEFCDWAGYRLPTEAEWEYAAREGGRNVRFGNGKDIADPSEINFDASAQDKKPYLVSGIYRQKTMPVASFSSNSISLYDMSGNVCEWCSDRCNYNDYNNYFSSLSQNPLGPSSGSHHVLRGGSWCAGPSFVRCTVHVQWNPIGRPNDTGFRVAR